MISAGWSSSGGGLAPGLPARRRAGKTLPRHWRPSLWTGAPGSRLRDREPDEDDRQDPDAQDQQPGLVQRQPPQEQLGGRGGKRDAAAPGRNRYEFAPFMSELWFGGPESTPCWTGASCWAASLACKERNARGSTVGWVEDSGGNSEPGQAGSRPSYFVVGVLTHKCCCI